MSTPPDDAPNAPRARPALVALTQAVRRVAGRRIGVPVVWVALAALSFAALATATVASAAGGRRASAFAPEDGYVLYPSAAARGASGAALSDGGKIVVFASGLPALAAGYRFAVWDTGGAEPRWLGTLTVLDRSRARLVAAAGPLPRRIEITIESAAAGSAPAGPVVLAGAE